MVKVSLETKLPDIQGLEEAQRPLHLLQDADRVLYLITDTYSLVEQLENFPAGRGRVFIGRENEEMTPVGEVTKMQSRRDGGTTEVEFVNDSKRGEIYVPNCFRTDRGQPATLTFKGEIKELRKVGYQSAYLFSVLSH